LLESTGFPNKGLDRLHVRQLRRSAGYTNRIVPFWIEKNLLVHFTRQNFVKGKSRVLIKHKHARRLPDSSIDNVPVYVIRVTENPFYWVNTLFIRQDNFAIIKCEEQYDRRKDGEKLWYVDSNPLIQALPKYRRLEVTYRELDGKYYPESYRLTFHTLYNDKLTGKTLQDFQIEQLFLVTGIHTQELTPLSKDQFVSEHVSLQKLPLKYDSVFWSQYTILRETPLDSMIRIRFHSELTSD
jgi:1,2-phenylacetyl-CoA epoxidase PaaB subunit